MNFTTIYGQIHKGKYTKRLINPETSSSANIFADTAPNIQIRIPEINKSPHNHLGINNSILLSPSAYTTVSTTTRSNNNGLISPHPIKNKTFLENYDQSKLLSKRPEDESLRLGSFNTDTSLLKLNTTKSFPSRIIRDLSNKYKTLRCKNTLDMTIITATDDLNPLPPLAMVVPSTTKDSDTNETLILPHVNNKSLHYSLEPPSTLPLPLSLPLPMMKHHQHPHPQHHEHPQQQPHSLLKEGGVGGGRGGSVGGGVGGGKGSVGGAEGGGDSLETMMMTKNYLENNALRMQNECKRSFMSKLMPHDTEENTATPKDNIAGYLLYLNSKDSENEQVFKQKLEFFSLNGFSSKQHEKLKTAQDLSNKKVKTIEKPKPKHVPSSESRPSKNPQYKTSNSLNKNQHVGLNKLNDLNMNESLIMERYSTKKATTPDKFEKMNTMDSINDPAKLSSMNSLAMINKSYMKFSRKNSKKKQRRKQDAKLLTEIEALLDNYRLFYDNIAKYKCSEENFKKIMGDSEIILDLFQSKSIPGKFREPPTAQKLLNTIRGVVIAPKKSIISSDSLRRVSLFSSKPVAIDIDTNVLKALKEFNERIEAMNLEYLLTGIKHLQTGLFKLQDENIEKEKMILPKLYKTNKERFLSTKELCETQHTDLIPNPNYNLSTKISDIEAKDGVLEYVSMRNKRINKEFDNVYENWYLNCWKIAKDKTILAKPH